MYLSVPHLPAPPTRIVSLVPSITELLYDLSLEAETVGITKFCIHPDVWFRSKRRVGGTKNVHLDTVRALQPDIILANKEENVREQVDALAVDFPVWLTDVQNMEQALQMIASVGRLTHRESLAMQWMQRIREEMPVVTATLMPAVYLIWKEPFMVAGGDTFIQGMMKAAGFENVFSHSLRYPEVTVEDIRNSGAKYLLLSSEPYPFSEKHLEEFRETFPGQVPVLADGTYFSWYGSRMADAFKYFRALRQEWTPQT